jgi:ribonuclease HI
MENMLQIYRCEYEALIKALELASKVTDKEVTCILDSELVVKQLLGEYKVKHPDMLELFLKVQKLLDKFERVKFEHVSREDPYQQMATKY